MLLSFCLWQILLPHWQMVLPLCVLDVLITHVRFYVVRQMMLLPLCDRFYVTIVPVYVADVIAKVADVIANQLQIFLAAVIAI